MLLTELSPYIAEILSICVIAIFMAVSPGSDFVIVTHNSISHGRSSGLYSALGVGLAIWIHVAYSIAGLAVIISNSVVLFSIIKYLGAAYLIYVGWKSFRASSSSIESEHLVAKSTLSKSAAFKMGFISNALNPKTTLFFLSVFTQVIDPETPLLLQVLYGAIISLAHFLWFVLVSMCLSHPALLTKFNSVKHIIEKCIGGILIAFGLKVALSS